MLRYQLPYMPPIEPFLQELRNVFKWIYKDDKNSSLQSICDMKVKTLPARAHSKDSSSIIEKIRFAAHNRICVRINIYNDHRVVTVEPYALLVDSEKRIFFHGIANVSNTKIMCNIQKIESFDFTNTSFEARYKTEV